MKKLVFLLWVSVIPFTVLPQKLSPDIYWVQLRDKKGTEYDINNPEFFLSERAINRRLKYDIPVNEEDLPVSRTYRERVAATGAIIRGSSKWFNGLIIQSRDSIVLSAIERLPFVENFSTDYSSFSTGGTEEHKDPASVKETEMEALFYGTASKQINLLSGNFLHNYGYRGQGMIIAVLDGGFYKVNEIRAFKNAFDENRILATKDFVNPGSPFYTHSTHGLSVLSTMAGYLPDTFVGTAPKASYLLLRSENGSGETKAEEAYWLQAAEYADSAGADIITSSLGYYDYPLDSAMNYSYEDLTGINALVTRAAEKAFSKGMVVVASAGNEGSNEDWIKITPPADGKNVLAVGSVDTAYNVTEFSSRGNTQDGRIKPDLMAVGFQTRIINAGGNPANGYGTSFAAPQIAGLIACLWQAAPEKTNLEIINTLRESSDQYQNPDSISGYGIPDFMLAYENLIPQKNKRHTPDILISPNPFSSVLEVKNINADNKIQEYNILSSDGKLLYSFVNNALPGESITITELETASPGIYYIIGKTTGGDIVEKFIKQ